MEQFNLEKYKTLVAEGKTPKVVTRGGLSVRIICTDREAGNYPIIALVDDGFEYISFAANGSLNVDCRTDLDLFFAEPEPTCRPYKNAEELYEAIKKHGAYIKLYDSYRCVLAFFCDGEGELNIVTASCCSGSPELNCTKHFFREVTWADGAPFGVKE